MTIEKRNVTPTNIHLNAFEQNVFFLALSFEAQYHSLISVVLKGISKLHLKCENRRQKLLWERWWSKGKFINVLETTSEFLDLCVINFVPCGFCSSLVLQFTIFDVILSCEEEKMCKWFNHRGFNFPGSSGPSRAETFQWVSLPYNGSL